MADCIEHENICFFSKNEAVDEWTITSSTAAVGYAATRITETGRKLTWRSTAIGSQWIQGAQITAGVSMDNTKKRGIVVINHNLAGPTGTIQIQLWDTTPAIVWNATFNALNYTVFLQDYQDLIGEIRPYQYFVVYVPDSVPTFTMSQWRLTFLDSAPTYYEVGRVFVGEAFQPKDNFYYANAGISAIDNTRVESSYGGDYTSDNRPRHRGLMITPPDRIKNLDDIPEWFRLIHVNGKRIPVFVDPYPQTAIPPDFTATEQTFATFNLLSQMYGTIGNDMSIAWDSEFNAKASGRLFVEEQA